MNVELVINSTPNEVVIGLLNDKRLIELHKEKNNIKFSVGDIYLGKVKKVMTGLNAAFVDVGYENLSYFHRIFKTRFGMSPREYRVNATSKTSLIK